MLWAYTKKRRRICDKESLKDGSRREKRQRVS
jgi:hypothetical protein